MLTETLCLKTYAIGTVIVSTYRRAPRQARPPVREVGRAHEQAAGGGVRAPRAVAHRARRLRRAPRRVYCVDNSLKKKPFLFH